MRFAPIKPLRPPHGAPNILLVLLDDAGFGAGSAFGGPCAMPVAERLAANGLRYTRFHTTALCSPTRTAALAGGIHHAVGVGHFTQNASASRARTRVLRRDHRAPLPAILRRNGYATAHFGRCHDVPVWAMPEDRDPSMPDLADQAIGWIRRKKSPGRGRPFFVYFVPGATYAPPCQAPQDWIDQYRGKFDAGWDQVREETLVRQNQLGVVAPDCEATRRPDEIPAWDQTPAELKPVLARQMETYAAHLSDADHHVGRIIDAVAELGELENTLVIYIIGDNGASAEGTLNDTLNPDAMGWAHALCAPYQWTERVASHFGGTRNGTVVHWPKGFAARGEIRHQFHHVIDLAPTILEAAGLPEPRTVHGSAQEPMHGMSMCYSFDDAAATDRHDTPYFETIGRAATG